VFKVPIDKIIPVTNARARIASLVSDVQKTNCLYVLTRGGKPAAVLASVDYLDGDKKAKTEEKLSPVKSTKKPVVQVKVEDNLQPDVSEMKHQDTSTVEPSNEPFDEHQEEQAVKININ